MHILSRVWCDNNNYNNNNNQNLLCTLFFLPKDIEFCNHNSSSTEPNFLVELTYKHSMLSCCPCWLKGKHAALPSVPLLSAPRKNAVIAKNKVDIPSSSASVSIFFLLFFPSRIHFFLPSLLRTCHFQIKQRRERRSPLSHQTRVPWANDFRWFHSGLIANLSACTHTCAHTQMGVFMQLLKCEISLPEEQPGLLSNFPSINDAWLLNKEIVDYGFQGRVQLTSFFIIIGNWKPLRDDSCIFYSFLILFGKNLTSLCWTLRVHLLSTAFLWRRKMMKCESELMQNTLTRCCWFI